ncbi:hypothetical protein BDV36DRAFT_248692, partial [Aspergillus pseudocaelatus]
MQLKWRDGLCCGLCSGLCAPSFLGFPYNQDNLLVGNLSVLHYLDTVAVPPFAFLHLRFDFQGRSSSGRSTIQLRMKFNKEKSCSSPKKKGNLYVNRKGHVYVISP